MPLPRHFSFVDVMWASGDAKSVLSASENTDEWRNHFSFLKIPISDIVEADMLSLG